ncbi:MAG: D-glycerate dehydrogenase [Chthonomonadales bacterium]|nr:D-glycerate dehydrogenase [Chthonomonadales bacterium]
MTMAFVTRPLPEEAIALVRDAAETQIWPEPVPPPRDVLLRSVRDVDGLLCLLTDRIDDELLDHAPRLRVVSQMAVGYDNIDVAACTRRGVAVGNTPGVLTETTADLAFALLMATARRLAEAERFVRSGAWSTWSPMLLTGPDVHHATLGIVGMGRIGYEVARRAAGFQMGVLYADARPSEAAERDFGARRRDLDALLEESDFVTLHTPLLPETRHLIGAAQLARMKPTAILVNTSRGAVVDEQALHEALSAGRIAAAGLDVYEVEPLPANSPLLQLDNVVLLPHIGSASVPTRTRMAVLAAENLVAGLRGQPLPNPVN